VAVRRKVESLSGQEHSIETPQQLDKLTRLLALLVIKGESQGEKIKVLAGAGFTNTEIAQLLGLTANAVNVALFRSRKSK
jgi:DNA-directed RNA polymerase specialized sigma24 family protein